MIITNGVGYVHIQKTAGTSIRQAMMKSGPTFYIGQVRQPREDVSSRGNRYNAHFNPSIIKPILSNLFMFTCVRNPWDRLVSWYSAANDPRTFEEFVRQLYGIDKQDNLCAKPNSPVQGNFFKSIKYDLVLTFEELDVQWSLIQEKIGSDEKLRQLNQSNHRIYRDYYTPELRSIVANKEKYVIERFGYTFK